ncbi:hypothetical protein TeGR_g12149 [Tetraparma gracilis]|uniref:Uncharacterized protein n=1 Tax=Tetraparma gracilis TaxID=2962635 RepID=A0ABQ6N4Y1_9STRA|nr:hypothetical protein TeGR_g12149 [Tetraparma gracilis]
MPMWIVDGQLYGYEYSTATVVRMLQLSFPDEDTAMLIGLAGAVVEVGTRIFFYNMFLKAGLANPKMTAEEKFKYAKRGKLRVQDASNDMVVEYVSSITAGLFLIYLAPTGVFSFASENTASTGAVIKLCAFQIVPEIFLDFYCTFMEVYGGLKDVHLGYWKISAGANENANLWTGRIGDLPKAMVLKVVQTWAFISFVLIVCVL